MNTLKSNNKTVKSAIDNHIMLSVYDDNEINYNSIKDACLRLKSEFERVGNKRILNLSDRFSDYLCGLPFNFEYENYKINEYLESIGLFNKKIDYSKSMKLYHYLIYKQMIFNTK